MKTHDLSKKTIAILATDGFEQVEFTKPKKAVEEAGGTVHVISLKSGKIQGFNHAEKADTFEVDKTVDSVKADDYDGLILPGGVHNPDALRVSADAVFFRPGFFQTAQTRRRDMPWPMDTDRSRCGQRPHRHFMAKPEDRPEERRCQLGG